MWKFFGPIVGKARKRKLSIPEKGNNRSKHFHTYLVFTVTFLYWRGSCSSLLGQCCPAAQLRVAYVNIGPGGNRNFDGWVVLQPTGQTLSQTSSSCPTPSYTLKYFRLIYKQFYIFDQPPVMINISRESVETTHTRVPILSVYPYVQYRLNVYATCSSEPPFH